MIFTSLSSLQLCSSHCTRSEPIVLNRLVVQTFTLRVVEFTLSDLARLKLWCPFLILDQTLPNNE